MSSATDDRDGLAPALAGSAVLHVLVAALFLVSWPWAKELKIGSVVPVKIVTNAPNTDVRPAEQAPEEQEAATEEPVPNESLQAPAPPEPAPQPEHTPAKPTPAPAKSAPPTPAPPKPTPPVPTPKPSPTAQKTPAAKPQPAPSAAKPTPHEEVDLDKLLASVSKSGGRPTGQTRSSAPRGPTRTESARQARPAAGTGLSANAFAGFKDELQRRWNPNCDVEGGRDVRVKVTFTIGMGGEVAGDVTADAQGGGGAIRITVNNSAEARGGAVPTDVVRAGAERAIRAVYGTAPYRGLPPAYYGQRIIVNFNALEACA